MGEELNKLAWQMHQDGCTWPEVAGELRCATEVVQQMAAKHARDMDEDAARNQFALFEM